jgi:hypothetical protein
MTVELPVDGHAITGITVPESATAGALLPVEVQLDAGATAGLQIAADETPVARMTVSDADGDGTVTTRVNTHALLANSDDVQQLTPSIRGADTAEMTMVGAADHPTVVEVAGIDTTHSGRTQLQTATPNVHLERAPAGSADSFRETSAVISGERLRLRVTDPALVGLRHARGGELGAPIAEPLPDAYTPHLNLSPDRGAFNLSVNPQWTEGGYTLPLNLPPTATALTVSVMSASETVRVVEPAILQADPLMTNLAPQTTVELHLPTGTHRTQITTDGGVPVEGTVAPSRITVPGSQIELTVPATTPLPTDTSPASDGEAFMEAVRAQLLATPGLPTLPAGITTMQVVRYLGAVLVVLGVVWVGLRIQRQRND